jgi:DNA-directed RNA polymerase sigma subunit (sigma70/sigma32)
MINDSFSFWSNRSYFLDPLAKLDEEEILYEKLEDILNNITERDREIIQMRFVHGKTLREISCHFALSKGRVGSIIQDIIKKHGFKIRLFFMREVLGWECRDL